MPERRVGRRSSSGLVTRNITVRGGRTSMRLEPELWDALEEVCRREGINVSEIIERAQEGTRAGTRTSAVRTYLVNYFRDRPYETR